MEFKCKTSLEFVQSALEKQYTKNYEIYTSLWYETTL